MNKLCVFYLISFIFIKIEVYSTENSFVEINSNFKRTISITTPVKVNADMMLHFSKMNPFVRYEYSLVHDLKEYPDQKIIYDVKYQTGVGGLRLVPNAKPANRHFIISGDSTVFGVGVLDNETTPFFLQKKLKNFEVINLGIGGGGPTNVLYFLDFYGLDKVLLNKSKEGIFIYQFEHYLTERVIGTKNFVKWGGSFPFYKELNGKFQYSGTFEERWISKFYKVLNYFQILDPLIPNLPRIDESEYELVAKMLIDMGERYKKATSLKNDFVVVLNPTGLMGFQRPIWEKMKKSFKKVGLKFVELSFEEREKLELIPGDGHFTSKGNEYVANRIIQLLKLN